MRWNKRNGQFAKDGANDVDPSTKGRTVIRETIVWGADPWVRRWTI